MCEELSRSWRYDGEQDGKSPALILVGGEIQ